MLFARKARKTARKNGLFPTLYSCLRILQKRNLLLKGMKSTERFIRKMFHLQNKFLADFSRAGSWSRPSIHVLLEAAYPLSWGKMWVLRSARYQAVLEPLSRILYVGLRALHLTPANGTHLDTRFTVGHQHLYFIFSSRQEVGRSLWPRQCHLSETHKFQPAFSVAWTSSLWIVPWEEFLSGVDPTYRMHALAGYEMILETL